MLDEQSLLNMPFVLMCGTPGSGKTTRAEEVIEYFSKKDAAVIVINDADFCENKNTVYADSQKEKVMRGNLKAAVQRLISKEGVLVLDSLNYIKGFRYELYCAIKSAQSPQCVIYCEVDQEVSSKWNSDRAEGERYVDDVFEALTMRFEAPVSSNRWDSSLFSISPQDTLPLDAINEALFVKKAPPPNFSTLSQPLAATNFLHELDRMTQRFVRDIMTAQQNAVPGDSISIPGTKEHILFTRTITLAELQRTRRKFISFTKSHPVEDVVTLPNMFVQFVNNSLR